MKYEIIFSCGHEGTINLVGLHADRERKLEWYRSYAVCPECYKRALAEKKASDAQERQEATEAAQENADLYGWPYLEGSNRQIAWAVRLRQEFYDWCIGHSSTQDGMQVVSLIIDSTTSAAEWIDNRTNWMSFFVSKKESMTSKATAEEAVCAVFDSIVEPVNRAHPGAVEIICTDCCVKASYTPNGTFQGIVKRLGFRWDRDTRYWYRDISLQTGQSEDRAAELGNALLLEGFAIKAENPKVHQMAVDGSFQPEKKRWLMCRTSGRYMGCLVACFHRGDLEAEAAAKNIPGARWDKGSVVIPINEYASAVDMAGMMGYGISDGAKRAISEYLEKIEVRVPTKLDHVSLCHSPSEILSSSRDVLPDLKDDVL